MANRRADGAYRAALRSARAAAAAAPSLLPRVCATVRENLRLAFGEADPRLVRDLFGHFASAAVDLLFFRRIFDPGRFDEHFTFSGGGLEHWRDTKPSAAVFVTGHFGNWELYGAAFRHIGIPLAVVARPPGKGWFAQRVERFRKGVGQEVIPKDQALPLSLKALRRGTPVAFLMDQAAGRHGIPVPFFGRPAYTFTGPAALARKLSLPVYAGYSTRLGDGIRYRCFAEPVTLSGEDDADTATLNRKLEQYVRDRPEQWWWFHRRFKPPRSLVAGRKVSPAGIPR